MTAKVSDYMQSKVTSVSPQDTLAELERKLSTLGIGGAPVLDGNELVGVVSRTDVLRALVDEQDQAELIANYYLDIGWPKAVANEIAMHKAEQLQQRRVRDIMSTQLLTIAPDAALSQAAKIMLERHIHRLPVTQGKTLVGILTTQDILRSIVQQGH